LIDLIYNKFKFGLFLIIVNEQKLIVLTYSKLDRDLFAFNEQGEMEME